MGYPRLQVIYYYIPNEIIDQKEHPFSHPIPLVESEQDLQNNATGKDFEGKVSVIKSSDDNLSIYGGYRRSENIIYHFVPTDQGCYI